MRRLPLHLPVSLFLLVLALSAPAAAAENGGSSTPGGLSVSEPSGAIVEMPLRHTRVLIEVASFVARVEVEQTFANPYDHPVEAVYTFPLGDRAAVDDFELVVGDRTIHGEIKRRVEARQVYEAARDAGYQAALLEQERPNLFTQSIANLEPRADVKVRLRTVEVLRYEAGVYRLTFPLVVGPRYIPGGGAAAGTIATGPAKATEAVSDAGRITPPVLRPEYRSGHDVEISVALDAGVPISNLSSPSHRIAVERLSASTARVSIAADDAIPNKDFLLRWSVSSEKPALGLLAHRDGGDGFFALLVQPRGEVSAAEASPKELVLVLDTSGSMQGIPLEASKRFAREALLSLGPRDTFNLVRFAAGASLFADEPLPGDRASVERGRAWIDLLAGNGGTEMLTGLKAAFERPPDPDRMRVVVFLTDGYIGNEHQILAEIGKVAGEARIYTVGIGTSVNHYLLDRMAAIGRGAYLFVRPDEKADEALDRFRAWVTRPYLTDLRVDWGALPVADLVPEVLPDAGSGQNLTIVGRYLGAGSGEVIVRGRLAGAYWEQRLEVVLPEREKAHAPLASVWARHRIDELLMGAPGPVPPSVEAAVTSLALEYRLMSPFTSFVAVDDSRVVNPGGRSETIHQALPIPEGTSFGGVFGAEGPPGLKAISRAPGEQTALAIPLEDSGEADENDRLEAESDSGILVRSAGAGGAAVVGGVVGGVLRGVLAAPPPSARYVQKTAAPNGAKPVAALANANPARPRIESPRDRSQPAGFYQTVLTLAAREDADGVGRATTGARARLLESAIRVLVDLAEDGKLAPSEGKPSLAALLAAQTPSGAVAEDLEVQAFAAWALSEAAVAIPRDPWVRKAADKAVADLALRAASSDRSPVETSRARRVESLRWTRLILGLLRPGQADRIEVPQGDPSARYLALTRAASASALPARLDTGHAPWDRLLRSVRRGHLACVR